jgi:hypothetical protein
MLDAWSRIYEPELYMTFPAAKKTMTQKAVANYGKAEDDSWENW